MFPITDFLTAHGVAPNTAATWGALYLPVMKRYGIDTKLRVAAFFSNVIIESGAFKHLSENLNYSADRLAKVWPNRYSAGGRPNALAMKLHRNPELIANYTYGNRGGNGGPETGDGWRYRGRGPMQTTFKNNYAFVQEHTGMDCIDHPEILETPQGGVIASALYWFHNRCNLYADRDDIDGVRDVINIGKKTSAYGDGNGFREVKALYDRMKLWLNRVPTIDLPAGKPIMDEE